ATSCSTTPGEPWMSSAVPNTPSGPGWVTFAERGSPPPWPNTWQVPQATVREADSCSSQNSALPSKAFCGVVGLPTGSVGGTKKVCVRAADATANTATASATGWIRRIAGKWAVGGRLLEEGILGTTGAGTMGTKAAAAPTSCRQ